jgi:essential nuclear protein 1
MSKLRKAKKWKAHESLTQQILGRDAPRNAKRTKSKKIIDENPEDGEIVGEKLTRKILKEVRIQQDELEEEHGFTDVRMTTPLDSMSKLNEQPLSSDNSDVGEEEHIDNDFDYDIPIEISQEDEKAMALFQEPYQRRTLADIIMEKIKDKETELSTRCSDLPKVTQLDDKVVEVFKAVGEILSKYRAGKLPKAFKVIPSLSNWEELLYLTEPEKWSAATMFQATKIFSSNLSVDKVQRFYNLVLLPRIRDDIAEFKRLNFHLYMALKRSLFKPAAFFKGILLPLLESGSCTLREALIIASVIAKTSIPLLHSSAALLKIAEMNYSGASSIFIRTLLDKKYALPYRVIDAVVFHFLKFLHDPRTLPVLWHQSLLTFVQRYKEDMSLEQKEALIELIRSKNHYEISSEIRREIVGSTCRDVGVTYDQKQL